MDIIISEGTVNVWQSLLSLLASKYHIPAALIMKIELPNITVFESSKSEGNPYSPGDKECLFGSGLYCERVINTKTKLLIPNALIDPEWDKNPDIKLGMISYLGFPILYPNGEVFGTICILDSKENSFDGGHSLALECFKAYIESYLDLKSTKDLQIDPMELNKKEIRCDELLTRIENLIGISSRWR